MLLAAAEVRERRRATPGELAETVAVAQAARPVWRLLGHLTLVVVVVVAPAATALTVGVRGGLAWLSSHMPQRRFLPQ